MMKKLAPELPTLPGEINSLYVDFVNRFYGQGKHTGIAELADRLQELLARSPEFAASIWGEEVRSLLAEFHGDYAEAIRSREAEIRKILELHTLAVNTPRWDYVSRQYDFSDVSDRLDLLAILYDRIGDIDRALAVLRVSRQYCAAHHIEFDGQELLKELETERISNGSVSRKRTRKSKAIR